jgi:hypothetical protein
MPHEIPSSVWHVRTRNPKSFKLSASEFAQVGFQTAISDAGRDWNDGVQPPQY